MKYHAIGALMLGLVACTAANPSYVGPGGGPDGAVPADGAVPDLGRGGGPGDLGPVCQDGQRACLALSASASCTAGQYTLDRKCPTGSKCMTGYCGAPPQMPGSAVGLPCDAAPGPQENQCIINTTGGADTLSCEPFVDPQSKAIHWACARPIGQGLPGAPCTLGTDCRTGFCGDNGTCFRACQGDNDCPLQPTGKRLSCRNVKITVEGVPVEQGSCVP